jgi:hypothetical protein
MEGERDAYRYLHQDYHYHYHGDHHVAGVAGSVAGAGRNCRCREAELARETAVPKLMPQSRPVGHARRTKPKSALAKLEAKELSQARAERRFADHRRRDSAERMKQLRAGAVCFD